MKFSDIQDDFCVPLSISERCSEIGSRIGGRPPALAQPMYSELRQYYFGTLCFDDGISVSIFYSLDKLGRDEERDILAFNNQLLTPSKLIHAVVHEESPPNEASMVRSEVSCHRIVLGERVLDEQTDDDRSFPFVHSKIGRHPFIDNPPLVGRAFFEAATSGYRQLVQFDTPSPSTHRFVESYPWDPGWLHVFFREEPPARHEFAFIIQQ